ncbi:MAG: hypothetical protein GC205_12765 [Bacteroidetes bacterium]|nr:hypothetical protein [Bacteroidota bacterium]
MRPKPATMYPLASLVVFLPLFWTGQPAVHAKTRPDIQQEEASENKPQPHHRRIAASSQSAENPGVNNQDDRFLSTSGRIDFVSEAPLESIKAWSDELRGVLEFTGAFAFSVSMSSFEGFNSGLQRQHFQENYLEISRFPKASFEGHLIERPDLSRPGTYPVRVRGQLTIHGVTRERILPGSIQVMPDKSVKLSATFDIPLRDHGVNIPKIMHQKIAESVRVAVNARLVVPS